MVDTTPGAKSATDDDAQHTTTRRTFLGAAAAVAGLGVASSSATATTDTEATTDYYPKRYETDERIAATGAPILPTRTPTVNQVAAYLNVEPGELATICMAARFTGDDPDHYPDMAHGIAEELRALADEVDASQ